MTQRETLLLRLMGATALSALVLWGAQTYFDESTRLDQRFSSLQKEAAQLQLKLVQTPEALSGDGLADRFWPPGTLPEPLVLARSIKPVLDGAGVAIRDFQVITSTPEEFVLKYTCEATAAAQLQALLSLRADPRLLVRQFSATLKERGIYLFTWEVAYAVLP